MQQNKETIGHLERVGEPLAKGHVEVDCLYDTPIHFTLWLRVGLQRTAVCFRGDSKLSVACATCLGAGVDSSAVSVGRVYATVCMDGKRRRMRIEEESLRAVACAVVGAINMLRSPT